MATLQTIQVQQIGDIGGTGVSGFHVGVPGGAPATSAEIDAAATALHTFYTSVSAHVPSDVSFSIVAEVRVFDVDSGKLTNELVTSAAPAAIPGSGSGIGYAAGVGGRLQWETGIIRDGRRVRGTTFLVPLDTSAYGVGGSITATASNALTVAANTLLAALQTAGVPLMVYSRPAKGAVTGGAASLVQSGQVGNVPATLRSRRV